MKKIVKDQHDQSITVSNYTGDKLSEIVKDFNDDYFVKKSDSILNGMIDKYSKFASIATAIKNEEIVGYFAYYKNRIDLGYAFISMIVVKKEYRQKGIASLLMKYVIDDCVLNGFKTIRLKANNQNERAITWYKKLGFIFEYIDPEEDILSWYRLDL